jgi:ATP-dependent exoDNAse (exonuclease V) beta subunit
VEQEPAPLTLQPDLFAAPSVTTDADPEAQDAAARARSLDTGTSLLLSAPAGSGKTTVLTARFLALLAHVQEPEQILAVTFTRKAAAEMRARVMAALRAGEAGEDVRGIPAGLPARTAAHAATRGWQLFLNPVRLRVETIDALNYRLATQLPLSAHAAPRLDIAMPAEPLYRRAARRALQAALEETSQLAVFERLDNNWRRLESLLTLMLAGRSHWLARVLSARDCGLAERVRRGLRAVVAERLAAALVAVPTDVWAEASLLSLHAAHVRSRRGSLDAGLSAWLAAEAGGAVPMLRADGDDLPRWRALCALFLTTRGEMRRSFTVNDGFEAADGLMKRRVVDCAVQLAQLPQARETLGDVRGLPSVQLAEEEGVVLEALAGLLERAAAELQLVFAEQGQVDYAYVAAAARAALTEDGQPTDLALRTGAALQHVLVDEFQDTSREQFLLLQALTAGWEAGDGRTLFVVGDPMQSIYQFREAEVGLFLHARDHGLGMVALEALSLRRNFRCAPGVLDWVNRCFAQLFPTRDDAQLAAVRYLASTSGVDDPCGGVQLHRLTEDPKSEAERVLDIVRQTRERQPGASIAILVASRLHAAQITQTLQAAGVTLRGIDLTRLDERPAVRDLSMLTRALLHAADRSAWLALLRAPWCGLSLAELEQLTAAADASDGALFEALGLAAADERWPVTSRQRLARVCAALGPALCGEERGLPLWRRVEYAWLRLGGPALATEARDLDDAHAFLDALAQRDDAPDLAGEALGQVTLNLYSAAVSAEGAVDVMTMHAAKGLEWDVVILPGLGRSTARDHDPLLHWLALPGAAGAEEDLLLAPIRGGDSDATGSLGAFIKRLRRQRTHIERLRLAYVAATRARRTLHLLGHLPPARPDAERMPRSGSLLELLWPAIGQEFLHLPECGAGMESGMPGTKSGAAPAAGDRDAYTLQRLAADWSLPEPPAAPAVERLQLSLRQPEAEPQYEWVGLTTRAVGTIVHAELHRLSAGVAPEAAPAPPDYAAWLADLGVPEAERAHAAAQIRRALEQTLQDVRARWLLAPRASAQSEYRLTGLQGGRIVNVVLDRMFVDEQGRRWIVDFKTSTHEGGALDAFFASEVARYQPQLARYAALARQLGPQPVHAALYFPLLARLIDVPLSEGAGE